MSTHDLISTEQLDKEIKRPLVKKVKMGSTEKFIHKHNWIINQFNSKGIEAVRPLTTKAFIINENNFLT